MKCLKCNSIDMVRTEVIPHNPAGGGRIKIRFSMFTVAQLLAWVCCDCGYVETFVDDKKFLDKCKKKS